jgi:hypothetical protein
MEMDGKLLRFLAEVKVWEIYHFTTGAQFSVEVILYIGAILFAMRC